MSKLKIVIADNESIIRMDLKEMLEEAGHEGLNDYHAEVYARLAPYLDDKNARNGWDYSCKENF